jgi:hypothetical protein
MPKVKILIAAVQEIKAARAPGVEQAYKDLSVLSLSKMIDVYRQPVADKARVLWLIRGSQIQGLLRDQPADVILGARGPVRMFDMREVFLARLLLGATIETARDSTCADAVAFAWRVRTWNVEDFQRVVKERSVERLINDCRNELVNYNQKRQPVADAAWFLLEHGICDWYSILEDRKADHIVCCANVRMSGLDEKRQPVADAAQWLWLSGNATNPKWFAVVGIEGLEYMYDAHLLSRKASADKAQTLHMDFGLGLDTLDEAVAAGEI